MNENRFADLTRALTRVPTRRDLLRGLASAGLGLGVARLPQVVAAKKKRKKRIQRNAFGCVNVGSSCRNAEQCCSGICEGTKGKRTCRAHDTGSCSPGLQPEGCGATAVACTTSLGKAGTCGTTTGAAGYCLAVGDCYACTTDNDCQVAVGGLLGPRAACIQCAECAQTGGTLCAIPGFAGAPG